MPHPSSIHIEQLLAHDRWLRQLALRLVGDDHRADDVVQATWQAALQGRPRHGGNLRGWLASVARRAAWRQRRHENPGLERLEGESAEGAAPPTDELVELADLQRHLVGMVTELSEPGRRTLLMHFLKGYSATEIARMEGVPASTVRNRLKRALDSLRDRLDREHDGDRQEWILVLGPFAVGSQGTLGRATLGSLPGQLPVWSRYLLGFAGMALVALGWIAASTPGDRSPSKSTASVEPVRGGSEELLAEAQGPDRRPRSLTTIDTMESAEPEASLGLVIDTGGRPVSGVRMAFDGDGSGEAAAGVTDADGVFRWSSRVDGLQLVADDSDWTTVLAGLVRHGGGGWPVTTVVARRRRVLGSVVDLDGAAIAGAVVVLSLPHSVRADIGAVLDSSANLEWSTVSDETGGFDLPRAPDLDGLVLECRALGYETWRGNLEDRQPEIRLEAFGLGAEVEIVGRVAGPDGTGVPDARVSVGERDTRTDARGDFRLRVPESLPNGARLAAVAEGFSPTWTDEPADGSSFVELRLTPQVEYSGRITDPSGEPRAELLVQVIPDLIRSGTPRIRVGSQVRTQGTGRLHVGPSVSLRSVTTNAEGRFHLVGPSIGAISVVVIDPATLQRATFDAGMGRSGLDFVLPAEPMRRLVGRLVDEAGEPLAQVEVAARRHFSMGTGPKGLGRLDMGGGAKVGVQVGAGVALGSRSVRTSADGSFCFESIAATGIELHVELPTAMPMRSRIPDGAAHVELRVVRSGHVRVFADAPANGIRFLDAEGEGIAMASMEGNVLRTRVLRANLHAGWTSVHRVPLHAAWVVVLDGEAELRRVPVAILREQLNTLRP